MDGQFVRSCCFIGPDNLVLAANYDGSLNLYSMKEKDIVRHQTLVGAEMQSNVIFCVNSYHTKPKEYNFLSSHEDRLAQKWEMGDLYVLEPQQIYRGHYDTVRYVCPSLDDSQICTCCFDNSLRVWDEASGKTKCILKGHKDNVVFADFVDEQTVVSASWDQTLKVFRLPSSA